MPYIKWGLTAATFALVMSVGLGLVAGVGALVLFLRALLFTVMFFVFGFALRYIITNYFPELLYASEEAKNKEAFEKPGSRINITVDTTGEYAVPELYKTSDDSETLGNIEDLVSGFFKPHQEDAEPDTDSSPYSTGIDRNEEQGYNSGGDFQSDQNFNFDDFEDPFQDMPDLEEGHRVEKPAFTPSFVDGSDDLGGLPDLDAMAMAFSPTVGESDSHGFGAGSASDDEFEPAQPYRGRGGNKPQPLRGDFDPKELAKGISTVLSKDK